VDVQPDERRWLAAVLAADVVGYSRLIIEDETATLAALRAARTELVEPLTAAHGGRVFAARGDSFLAEFPSSVFALRCALALQVGMSVWRAGAPGQQLTFRVGVHQGEVVEEGAGVTGAAVIIAVRLEALADPGGLCISGRVREDAAGNVALDAEGLGKRALKNIPWPTQVFKVRVEAMPTLSPSRRVLRQPSSALPPLGNVSATPEPVYPADSAVRGAGTASLPDYSLRNSEVWPSRGEQAALARRTRRLRT
jgi:adenylate cyclase